MERHTLKSYVGQMVGVNGGTMKFLAAIHERDNLAVFVYEGSGKYLYYVDLAKIESFHVGKESVSPILQSYFKAAEKAEK